MLQSEALKEVLDERVAAAGGNLAAALRNVPNVSAHQGRAGSDRGHAVRVRMCGALHRYPAFDARHSAAGAIESTPHRRRVPTVQAFQKRAAAVVDTPWTLAIRQVWRCVGGVGWGGGGGAAEQAT